MGGSGMGKSTLLYDLLTQLIMEGAGFALLDPHGELYGQILSFLTYLEYRTDDVRLIDATSRDITATVNPFTSLPEPDAIETKAQVLADLTLQVWGKESEAVRADKILYVLYVALLEQDRPLSDILSILDNPGTIRDAFARSEWEKLRGKPYLDSVTTRLKPLTHSRLKALTDPKHAIDFSQLINGQILLANLSRSDIMGDKECRTLSAFLVAEIWAAAFARRQRYPPFYLVIDEFKVLATEELANVLAQAQKFGLHLIFLHQAENQLPTYMRDAIGNVSCFIEFIGKGEVTVTGWGSGFNETYLEPEPVVHSTPVISNAIEQFRQLVTVKPRELTELRANAVLGAGAPEIETGINVTLLAEATVPNEPQTKSAVETFVTRGKGGPHHKALQALIKRVAEGYNFNVSIEKSVLDGTGSVDVSLEKENLKIACEVSVYSPIDHETKNVLKCLKAGYDHVLVVVSNRNKLSALKTKLATEIPSEHQSKVKALSRRECLVFLRDLAVSNRPTKTKREKPAGQRLDTKDASEFFGRSLSTIYRWAARGDIPSYRPGGTGPYQFDLEELANVGRQDLSAKKKVSINLEPIKIEKSISRSKKEQNDRYRKKLNLR